MLAKAVGRGVAYYSRLEKTWNYPLDPTLIREMLKTFADLKLSQELLDYLENLKRKQTRVFQATEDYSPIPGAESLWPFQYASVRFLEAVGRGILGHEMATGKTVIVSKAIDYLGLPRVLIVCPNSVKWSWHDHLRKWAGRQDVKVLESRPARADDPESVIAGNGSERDDRLAELIYTNESCIVIINFDQARLHAGILKGVDYDCLVVDEAHRIKNPKARQTQAVQEISRKCAYAWLLTGTPVRNTYTDLWPLLNICDPDRFTSYWNFVRIYLHAVQNPFGGIDVVGLQSQEDFNRLLSCYMFRKTKQEVLPDLPEKIYTPRKLELNPGQRKVYDKMEQEFLMLLKKMLADGTEVTDVLRAPNVISQLIRLRQICLTPALLGGNPDSAKLDALKEMLEDLRDSGQSFIVYTCFRRFLPFVASILDSLEISYAEIAGGQKSEARRLIEKDLEAGKVRCVLGTIQSMGEGLNLQAAQTAIFCDIDWVPANNRQAEDRIHRPGIKTSPNIVTLYHPDTVEADIRAACQRKERIIEETTGQVETIWQLLKRRGV